MISDVVGVALSLLEPEAAVYYKATAYVDNDPVTGRSAEAVFALAVALSAAISQKRMADSLRAVERSGLITRNRAI